MSPMEKRMIMDHLYIVGAYQNGDFPVRYVSRYQRVGLTGMVVI